MSILNTRLTQTQEEVMIFVLTAETPEHALTRIPQTLKHSIAVRQLEDIGAIKVSDSEVVITDDGDSIMFNNGMVDDFGELTAEFRKRVVESIISFPLLIQIDNRVN